MGRRDRTPPWPAATTLATTGQHTAAGPAPQFPQPTVLSLGPARLTAGLGYRNRLDLGDHQVVHGLPPFLDLADLVELGDRIALCGRGGAGFPFARKVRAVAASAGRRGCGTVVVVNATEGEPASWKDKSLLLRTPHLVLDGALIAARALRAGQIVLGVTGDGPAQRSLAAAIGERELPVATQVVAMPHRFVSGEAGALVRGINGQLPIPPGRKVRASDAGVAGLPTLLSNAETFAQLAVAARLGPAEYASVGLPGEPGTVLLTVTAGAARPCVVETPTGTALAQVLEACGTDPGQGLLTGGLHGRWITPEAALLAEVSRAGMAEIGGALGAGIVVRLDPATCPLGEVLAGARYLAGQSAGQCGPCRHGLADLARHAAVLADGSGDSTAVESLRAAAYGVRGRGACAHPDGTARFAISALEAFDGDVRTHLLTGGCGRPVLGDLPLPAAETDAGQRLELDWTRCDAHGLCAHIVPELVRLDANGYPVITEGPVPAWLGAQARKAVTACPALALRLRDDPARPRKRG